MRAESSARTHAHRYSVAVAVAVVVVVVKVIVIVVAVVFIVVAVASIYDSYVDKTIYGVFDDGYRCIAPWTAVVRRCAQALFRPQVSLSQYGFYRIISLITIAGDIRFETILRIVSTIS